MSPHRNTAPVTQISDFDPTTPPPSRTAPSHTFTTSRLLYTAPVHPPHQNTSPPTVNSPKLSPGGSNFRFRPNHLPPHTLLYHAPSPPRDCFIPRPVHAPHWNMPPPLCIHQNQAPVAWISNFNPTTSPWVRHLIVHSKSPTTSSLLHPVQGTSPPSKYKPCCAFTKTEPRQLSFFPLSFFFVFCFIYILLIVALAEQYYGYLLYYLLQ